MSQSPANTDRDPTWRPMRIAVVGGRGVPSNYSGVETIVENLFAQFADRGHKVTVYCRPQVLAEPIGFHKGMRLVRTSAFGGNAGETVSHTVLSCMHAMRKGDIHDDGKPFDLVSFHAVPPNIAQPVCAWWKVPTISHVHGLDHQRAKFKGMGEKVIRKAERLMVKHAAQVITVNREIVRYYKENFGLDAALLPNGIHPCSDDFTPDRATLEKFGITPGNFVVSIGRLVPEKRLHDTIEAFRRIETDKKLVIVGEGKHTPDYVRQLHDQARPDPRVIFTGLQSGDALQTLFRSAAFYVTASELEGLPSSLLECMDRAICPIVSDIPPHREPMEGVEGYDLFFKPGDADALESRIRTLLNDPQKSSRLGHAARAYVRRKYDWPTLAQATEKLYLQTLDRVARR